MIEHFPYGFSVVIHNVSAESDNGLHDELNKHSLELSSIISHLVTLEFLCFLIIVVVSPKFYDHLVIVNLELLAIDSSESS